jgi:hypothetical protein
LQKNLPTTLKKKVWKFLFEMYHPQFLKILLPYNTFLHNTELEFNNNGIFHKVKIITFCLKKLAFSQFFFCRMMSKNMCRNAEKFRCKNEPFL